MTVIVVTCPVCKTTTVCKKCETMAVMYCRSCPASRDYKPEHVAKELTGPILMTPAGDYVWIFGDMKLPITPAFVIPTHDRVPPRQRWMATA